jgi:flavodoxin
VNIGVIYYSQTGHTSVLADKLTLSLKKAGHSVSSVLLERSEPLQLQARYATLRNLPPVDPYDVLFIGTPVHGGRISASVLAFLEQNPSLSEKKVSFFLTHFLPRLWGTIQTIVALEEACNNKGAITQGNADVTWFSICRKKQVKSAIDQLGKLV